MGVAPASVGETPPYPAVIPTVIRPIDAITITASAVGAVVPTDGRRGSHR